MEIDEKIAGVKDFLDRVKGSKRDWAGVCFDSLVNLIDDQAKEISQVRSAANLGLVVMKTQSERIAYLENQQEATASEYTDILDAQAAEVAKLKGTVVLLDTANEMRDECKGVGFKSKDYFNFAVMRQDNAQARGEIEAMNKK